MDKKQFNEFCETIIDTLKTLHDNIVKGETYSSSYNIGYLVRTIEEYKDAEIEVAQ